MKRSVVTLLLFLAASPLLAQTSADVEVRLTGGSYSQNEVQRAAIRSQIFYTVQVTRPVNSAEVIVELDLPGEHVPYGGGLVTCTDTTPLRCSFPSSVWVTDHVTVARKMTSVGTNTATARLVVPTDSNPANDTSSWTIEVVDSPSLNLHANTGFGTRAEPGQAGKFWVDVYNYDGRTTTDVVLTLTLPEGGTFTGDFTVTDPAMTCTVEPARAVCTMETFHERTWVDLTFDARAPERLTGGPFVMAGELRSDAPDFDPADNHISLTTALIRHLLVTNTNDEGGGSLRQALLEAQQLCATEPCSIDFRISGTPSTGVFTIRPRTELPEVLGTVRIDGATQKAFAGDSNPVGAEIEIDGSLTGGFSRGFVLGSGCDMSVLELAVRNFPGPGIETRPNRYQYDTCDRTFAYPGTIVAHNHLTGNYRGVMLVGDHWSVIQDNFIGGNRRAGVFVTGGFHVDISRNLISGNGASGIFVDSEFAGIRGNRIIANGEWGVARSIRGDVAIAQNAIYDNRHLAIDAGLDLVTPNRPADAETMLPPNAPVLFSAHYDPVANQTIVRGRLDSMPVSDISQFVIDVYATRAATSTGQAEKWLGALTLTAAGDFEFAADGDFRGMRISATNTRWRRIYWDDRTSNTSELGNEVIAQ